MSLLKLILRRVDDAQRLTAVRLALTVLLVGGALLWFGGIWIKGQELRSATTRIVEVLRDANLKAGDAAAVEFAEKGTVTIGAIVYGDPSLARSARALYGDDGILVSSAAAARLMIEERVPFWAPPFLVDQPDTLVLVTLVTIGVLTLAIWTGLFPALVVTVLAAVVFAVPFVIAGSFAWIVAVLGIATLLFVFALLVRVASIALGRSTPTFAIASNVLREAMRLRVAIFFICALLIAIPILPLWIDAKDPLRYQVQTFLSRSTGLLFLLAAFMTVFLSCATVAFEIRDKQIWQLMTKPVARLQYLVGKWLGIVVLNIILLAIGGVSIFLYVQYLRTRPSKDMFDAIAVRDEVLVAREGTPPNMRLLAPDELRELVEQRIDADAMLKADIDAGERREAEVKREIAKQITQEFIAQQRSIPAGVERDYVFDGLGAARDQRATLTLRYAFDIGTISPHEKHPVIFRFSNGSAVERIFVPGQSHVLALPPDVIDDQGRLVVGVTNGGIHIEDGEQILVPGMGVMIFKLENFEVLFRVDGFETNFMRAMAVNLIKLSFLAMLGVCAATVLSFPVAAMLTFTVLAIGSLAPFLGISLDEYYPANDAPMLWQLFQLAIKGVATAAEWLLRNFGETSANSLLVEGRLVPWATVIRTFFVIGVVWTGGVFVLGYAAFRRKELAVYSGNS